MKEHYDVILVGAGLFNAVLAYRLRQQNKSVLVIERRNHIAGNCYDEDQFSSRVHIYGAHILHTSNEEVWKFVNQFSSFNNFINSPIANYHGELYNLPFNMNTFHQIFGVNTPYEVKQIIKKEIEESGIDEPKNLEEQAIKLVGTTIYKKLIKEYTEKQWGRDCTELDPSIIKRLPLRFTFDNNYFNDKYQGIPEIGYTEMIKKMYDGCDILLETDYLKDKEKWNSLADKVYYSGCIDEYYDYCLGELEYRGLRFENHLRTSPQEMQGVAVINYTSHEKKYTRRIEHVYFNPERLEKIYNGEVLYRGTVTTEYPATWKRGDEPYYSVNNERNNTLYQKYKEIENKKVCFVGRLGMYKYFDIDDTIEQALKVEI